VRGRRRIAFAVVATAIILVALLTPEDTGGRTGDPRLSSRSTQPQGASALYELAGRLGWKTTQRLADTISLGDTASVHLLLDPPIAPSATETHQILGRVRRGAGLVFVLGGGPLADSLGLGSQVPAAGSVIGAAQILVGSSGTLAVDDTSVRRPRRGWLSAGLPFWPDRQTHSRASVEGSSADGSRTLATVRTVSGIAGNEVPAVIGFPLDVAEWSSQPIRTSCETMLRVCRWGADVAAVRMLEYASADAPGGGRRQRFVFDDIIRLRRTAAPSAAFHVPRADRIRARRSAIGGRRTAAVRRRPTAPSAASRGRLERRSPLEHVDALAARTARSVRPDGHDASGSRRQAPGRSFVRRAERVDDRRRLLAWARERVPARSDDIDLVRQALERPVPRRQLEDVGQALRRLETSLTTFPRSS
jgi:hypothetical protein